MTPDRVAAGPAGSLDDDSREHDGPRRLLLTTDTVGGVWTYALELAEALAKRSVETVLATMGTPPDRRQQASARAVPGLQLVPSSFDLEWMEDPWADVERAGEWLLELEEEHRPDLVHLNGYAHGALPFSAPVLVVGHSCVLSWWEAVRDRPVPPRLEQYREIVGRGLRGADRVAAPTSAMLAALDRQYGPLPPSTAILNGRSSERFGPGEAEPTIFACGRLWDEAKNLEALERVAPELPWPVEVAGSLRHPAGGRRTPEAVRAPGPLSPDEVARRMGRAAICVHPARYEPFGLVPLEAALSGCALVLGDLATLREVWGDAALYVDPDDPDHLRDGLHRLIRSESLRSELARSARDRARHLSPERMADRYLDLYRSMLGEARLTTMASPQTEGVPS